MKKEILPSNKKKDPISKITQAFYELIIEKGYNKLSIRDIRDKANVAIGTIYHHFPEGKPAIMKKLILYFSTDIIKIDQVLMSEKILDPEYLGAFVGSLVKIAREYYSYYLAVLQALVNNPEFFIELNSMSDVYYRHIVKGIRRKYKNMKEIPEEDLVKAFKFISDTCNAYIERHMFVLPIFDSDEELITFLTKLIGYFLKTDFEILS